MSPEEETNKKDEEPDYHGSSADPPQVRTHPHSMLLPLKLPALAREGRSVESHPLPWSGGQSKGEQQHSIYDQDDPDFDHSTSLHDEKGRGPAFILDREG